MSTCSFIERLTKEKLRKLTYLGLLECDKVTNSNYLFQKSMNDVTINDLSKDNNNIFYSSISYDKGEIKYKSNFKVNDFEMTIYDGKWSEDLSVILHIYLASVFREEYLNALLNKRIADAKEEREKIASSAVRYLVRLDEFQEKRNKENKK